MEHKGTGIYFLEGWTGKGSAWLYLVAAPRSSERQFIRISSRASLCDGRGFGPPSIPRRERTPQERQPIRQPHRKFGALGHEAALTSAPGRSPSLPNLSLLIAADRLRQEVLAFGEGASA